MCAEVSLIHPGKVCRSASQDHCFKSAFGTETLYPGHRYYFELRCVKGTNFKFGIATAAAMNDPDQAFSDTEGGFAYFSMGSLRHASKGQGPSYGEKFKQDDVIGVYVDLAEGVLFFSKNGTAYTKNAF